MSVFAPSPQRGVVRDGDTEMMLVQQCRTLARHSPPQPFKRNCDVSPMGNSAPAGLGTWSPVNKRLRMSEQPHGSSFRNNDRGDGMEEEDEDRRHRKGQDRIDRHRLAAKPSAFDQAESTLLNKEEKTDAEIADQYIPLKKRRMHEHRMDGVVMTSVKERSPKEVTFTFAQVRSILAKALKEKELDLRLEFEAILQEKLMDQYQQFTKFNEDYVSRTRINDDASSWFYVS